MCRLTQLRFHDFQLSTVTTSKTKTLSTLIDRPICLFPELYTVSNETYDILGLALVLCRTRGNWKNVEFFLKTSVQQVRFLLKFVRYELEISSWNKSLSYNCQ